jgi:hypothetical protein
MVERRRRPDVSPRWLTIGEAARYLGHSPSWLIPERLARLHETGFPIVDPSLERIEREAIDIGATNAVDARAPPDDRAILVQYR